MTKTTGRRMAVGAMVAAAAGYIAGILTAPKSGKDTVADIKQTTRSSMSEAERQLKKLHTQLTTLLSEVKMRADEAKGKTRRELEDAQAKAQTVREKAREVLSALHEGDANDKDLHKAIQAAEQAIDHLNTYLKKA